MTGARSATSRLFLAVALDEDARHALAARLPTMVPGGPPGRAVPPENWHLTLRFLGPTTDVQRDLLLAALDERIEQPPFRVRLVQLGAFPRPGSATVLWVGVDDPDGGMARLAEACETAARDLGFEPDERPFHAHLTLARIQPPRSVADLVEAADPAGVRLDVEAVTLYRSVLRGRHGPSYEVVDSIAL